jgi:hypothetical protein
MSKWIIAAAFAIIGIIFTIIIAVWWVSTSNKEIGLRNMIVAKQTDNKNVYDSTWKQISQCAQVTDAQKQALLEIVVGYAKGRTGNGGGSFATSVKEVVPTMDTSTFNQLMNIITSARKQFERVQTEILDLSREHNNLIDMFPGSIVCGGRPKIVISLVTSSRTENAFVSGVDDDVNVFQKNSTPAER